MSNRQRLLGGAGSAPASGQDWSGRTVNVMTTHVAAVANPPPANVPATDGGTITLPQGSDPEPFEVRLSVPSGVLKGGDGNQVTVLYQVTYWVGNAQFTTPIKVLAQGFLADANRTLVFGNKVHVDLWAMATTSVTLGVSDIPVSVGIYPSTMRGSDRFSYCWAQPITGGGPIRLTDAVYGMPFNGGVIAQYEVELITPATGNENLWLGFYDLATAGALVLGTPILPGGRSPVMANANDWRNWGDDVAPGASFFTTCCIAALSKTPNTFTAPDGAPSMNLLVKVAQ